ncbi:hypothetical protein EDC01DRAFT_670105 [Geopyxis carbonaria]|nr:hypothetical protein EDC01DRAFT_670105 [Geopyxis carbonaria]
MPSEGSSPMVDPTIDLTEDKHMHFVITNAIFIPFLISTVGIRIYGRLRIVKTPLGWDDVLIFVAMIFGLGFQSTQMIAFTNGGGTHMMSMTLDEIKFFLMIWYISGPFYMVSMGFVKLSILALYLRLSPARSFRRLTYGMAAFIISLTVSNVLVMLFQCTPVRATWDFTVSNKSCININNFYFANAALNILTDVAVYILPMRMLWMTQLPKRQKISLCGIFALGGIACVASIVKLATLPQILESGDLSWYATTPLIWSVVEINVSVLAASLPAMKGLIKKYFPRLLSGISSGSRSRNRDNQSHELEYNVHMRKSKMETKVSSRTPVEHDDLSSLSNSSQDRINVPEGGIMKTTEVQVDVEAEAASQGGGDVESGSRHFC